MTIEYKWRIVEFIGADDEDKLKWPWRDILVCNEVTEFWYREFKQLLMRTKMFALLDFNPDDIDSRIKTEIEDKRRVIQKDVKLIVSTFKDNPFLPVAQRKEIEQMKESDPELRKVYGEWKYTKKTGLIYGDMVVIDKIPEDARYIWTWLDFWFVNSKTAVVDIYYKDKWLYRDEIVYSTWLLNRDISNEMEDAWKIKDETYIVADSAEHKSIIELRELWRDIEGADKWNDSVHFGIQYVKKFKRFVTARSVNIRKEDRNYKRKIWPDWKITNKPVKKFDDAFDAWRYLIMKALFVDHAEDEDWGDIDMYDDSLYLL